MIQARDDKLKQAMENVPTLIRWLPFLTDEELVRALEIESVEGKRRSVIRRLISRLVALRTTALRTELEDRYDG